MRFFTPWFEPLDDGTFAVNLTSSHRELLRQATESLRTLLMSDDPSLRRLFPPASADDAALDAEYQEMMRSDLLEGRFEAIDTIESTLERETLSEDELAAWLQSVNSLRLVLGTQLDAMPEMELEPDDPNYERWLVYELLGRMVSDMVEALATTLPTDDE